MRKAQTETESSHDDVTSLNPEVARDTHVGALVSHADLGLTIEQARMWGADREDGGSFDGMNLRVPVEVWGGAGPHMQERVFTYELAGWRRIA